jgi:hypothetical protein
MPIALFARRAADTEFTGANASIIINGPRDSGTQIRSSATRCSRIMAGPPVRLDPARRA